MRYSDTNEVCGYIMVCTQQLFQLPALCEQTGYLIHQVQLNSIALHWLDYIYGTIYFIYSSTTDDIKHNDAVARAEFVEYSCL